MPTHLIDFVDEFRLLLWGQSLDLVQQFPVNDETGSLFFRMIWWQVTGRERQDCGFSPGQVSTRNGRSSRRDRHGEKLFTRPGWRDSPNICNP